MRPLNAEDAHHSVLATARNWDANRIETDAHLINQPTLINLGRKRHGDSDSQRRKTLRFDSQFAPRRFQKLRSLPQEEKPERFVELVSEFYRGEKRQLSIAEKSDNQNSNG